MEENTSAISTELSVQQKQCPHCHMPITEEDYFCPNCGKKIKNKPLATTVGKQIIVYLVSGLLPPFGLPWAFRYLKQPDQKSKIIGIIVIILTIISLIVNVWLAIIFVTQTTAEFNRQLNSSLGPLYSQ